MPLRRFGFDYRRPRHHSPVSKSGDCTRLKNAGGQFKSGAGHHFGGRQRAAVDPCKIDVRSSTLRCSTISFPSSHLGEGAPLLTEEGTFESCGGSHSTTSGLGPDLARRNGSTAIVVEKIDMLPSSSGKDARFSAGRRGFESRWQCHIHLPVAQLDEQRATNAKVCRFESCREGQSPVNSSTESAPANDYRALAERSGDGL